ncbi:MAG: GTPase Era [Deltaproteobacteria bacterium]|nr:GTPase Era [Deltaproteobacteria bacterium]
MKSGYVAIIGRPNAGKSTLINKILGEKLAAVTDKPQTTRSRFLGIYSTDDCQIIFLDTPGVHESEKKLNQYMMEEVGAAVQDADVVLLLFDGTRKDEFFEKFVNELIAKNPAKKVLSVVNKMDLPPFEKGGPGGIFPISALRGTGVPELLTQIYELLSEGPAYYPTDELTDKPLRDIAAEIIREKAMELTFQEIPYSLAVEILSFKEEPKITRIEASLIVESESQKGMVIGKGGKLIKQIGSESIKDIKRLLGGLASPPPLAKPMEPPPQRPFGPCYVKVLLKLKVKVDKNWTKNPARLAAYGYRKKS